MPNTCSVFSQSVLPLITWVHCLLLSVRFFFRARKPGWGCCGMSKWQPCQMAASLRWYISMFWSIFSICIVEWFSMSLLEFSLQQQLTIESFSLCGTTMLSSCCQYLVSITGTDALVSAIVADVCDVERNEKERQCDRHSSQAKSSPFMAEKEDFFSNKLAVLAKTASCLSCYLCACWKCFPLQSKWLTDCPCIMPASAKRDSFPWQEPG